MLQMGEVLNQIAILNFIEELQPTKKKQLNVKI